MRSVNPSYSRLMATLFTLAMIAGFGFSMQAQDQQGRGTVNDWSTHHVVFSNPGTEQGAIQKGRYDHWWRVTNDPRYVMQQRRRNHSGREPRDNYSQKKQPGPHRDWAVSLGAGTVAQGMSPAKFSFDVTAAPSCANDFVVYGLNVAGSSGTDATASGIFTSESSTGATITITVNGTGYTFTAGNTNSSTGYARSASSTTQATNLVTAIGDNTTLNGLVTAVRTNGEVALTAKAVGGTITITTTGTTNFGTITSTAGTASQANLVALNNLYSGASSGSFSAESSTGATITITVNGTGYTFTAGFTNSSTGYARSASSTTQATNLVTAIGDNTTLNGLVTATSSGAQVSITTQAAGGTVTFTASGSANFGNTSVAYCATSPSYDWAYNATTNGGTVTTSPTISDDATGSSVIYVESVSGGSYLHVLKWVAGEGSNATTGTVAPSDILTAGLGVSSCTPGSSCLASIELKTTTGTLITSSTVTNSSPFYDYANDIVYVGDDAGHLFKVTNVLGSGTPAVTALTVSAGNALTGPVYDSSSSNVFVAGAYYLYAVKASTMALQTHSALTIGDTTCTSGNSTIYDGPIVDSSNNWVYQWDTATASIGDNTSVIQAYTTGNNSPSGTSWTAANTANVGQGDTMCNSGSQFPTWSPTFDNAYYTGTVTTGHMWVCGRSSTLGNSQAELWEIPTSGTGGALGTPVVKGQTGYISYTQHAVCSPMTEFYNSTTSTDYLFLGEGLSGSLGNMYGFTISGTVATPITPYSVPNATGGTSAIVVDNISSDNQASSIYFTTLATSTTTCGSTSAYCAIKLTQSGLQ